MGPWEGDPHPAELEIGGDPQGTSGRSKSLSNAVMRTKVSAECMHAPACTLRAYCYYFLFWLNVLGLPYVQQTAL